MTRFFIQISTAVNFVISSMQTMQLGEIFIPKMNSIYIKDLIKILCPKNKIKITGIRAGRKFMKCFFIGGNKKSLRKKDSFIILPHNSTPKKIIGIKK